MFYGSDSPAAAARFFNGVAGSNPSAKLFGPSALDAPVVRRGAVAGGPEPVRLGARVPEGGPDPGREHVRVGFTAAYGHAPAVQAIFGYEAMAAVLSVLKEAGAAADNRTTVVKDFFAIKNRQSVLGTYSINSTGDTSIAPFVFTRLKGGQLVPVTFVSVQG